MSKTSAERKVTGYLKPRNFRMFISETTMLMRSESENLNRIVEEHYARFNESHQNNLLSEFERLTKKK